MTMTPDLTPDDDALPQQIWEEGYAQGWEDGYSLGYDEGAETMWHSEHGDDDDQN